MKKKEKAKKKADMPEFAFKEFTPEESRIYDEAMAAYRGAIEAGKKLRPAYESYTIQDAELRSLIQADFLKILIAERHFARNEGLEKIAQDLDVASNVIRETHARMLQEVGITAANQFGQEMRAVSPDEIKTDD